MNKKPLTLEDLCRKPYLGPEPERRIPMSDRLIGHMIDGQFHSVKALADFFGISDQDVHNIIARRGRKEDTTFEFKNHRGVRYYRYVC